MNRNVALALGLVVVFVLTVGVLVVVMPGPHQATDYLVIGAIATLLCLLLLFLALIKTTKRPVRKPDSE